MWWLQALQLGWGEWGWTDMGQGDKQEESPIRATPERTDAGTAILSAFLNR